MKIFLISLLTFIAATIGTMTGFGTSTIMIPILATFLPSREAILLVGILHACGDIWKVTLFREGFRFKLIALFGISGFFASYLGASLSLHTQENILTHLLGLFLICYALFLFWKPAFKVRTNNIAALSGGALSGFFAGMFGVGGAIRSVFLSAFDLPKAVYIATAGAISLLVDSARLTTYFFGGVTLPSGLWWGLLFFIPSSFLGAQCARQLVLRIPQNKFRTIIAFFLLAAGINLLFFVHHDTQDSVNKNIKLLNIGSKS